MITIAVDAMGGDHAPRPEVEGSVLAARELGIRILLVGQPNVVRAELARHASPNLPIEIVPAGEVITMQDHPAQAFRRKKDSSVHVAARLVREAKADGMVSAGNTGAVMTVAKFLLGTLESVDRVALAFQIFGLLRKSMNSSLVSQVGGMLSKGAFKALRKTIDYTEYGGAPLLGVRGVCVIGHGRSNANAVKNAIRVAAGLARARMNEKIEQELSSAAVLA